MKNIRDKAPSAHDWAALCSAIMRCEVVLEKIAQDTTLTEERRRSAFAARLRKLEHEPAYRWLVAQPAYIQAMEAFTRRVAADDAARFELLSAVCYSMESLYSAESAPLPEATASTRRQAIRHANELALLVARDGAGFERGEGDEALLATLQRFIADNEKLARIAPVATRELTPQLRFGKDVAHLLYAIFGTSPPSVIRPLLRLAGPAVSDRDVAAVVGRMKREARLLTGRAPVRKGRYTLDRIVIAPTSKKKTVAIR
ncbi:MAG: hypothetical protein ACM3SS_09025 [Rhodospirillaceae bacterium]